MTTTYLRFPDEATWQTKAAEAGIRVNNPTPSEDDPDVMVDNWSWVYYTHDWSVDDVGVIYNDDGVYDPDTGEVITPPTPMDGWHVNFKSDLPINWSGFVVHPQTPYRIFAGD